MKHAVVTGLGVWTSAGRGVQALAEALEARRPCFSPAPPYDGSKLTQPRCGVAPGLERDRAAETLLAGVIKDALAEAGRDSVGVGLVAATSSGNVCGPWEAWHRAKIAGGNDPANTPDESKTGRDTPTQVVAERLGLTGPTATVSIACASGTGALAVALGWIEEGLADTVVVAGFDALSLYVHAGFNGLGALTASTPRPFAQDRDGLLLGEGAAALVIEAEARAVERGATVLARLIGAGLGADAFHATAPHREGRGAARGIRSALRDAGVSPSHVDMVSLHGTGTVFNDAMESHAMRAVFGDRPVAVHGIKASIGHTLGAAGAIEAAVVVHALRVGWVPPAPSGLADDCPLVLGSTSNPAVAVSTSSAFGGSNAAAVFASAESPRRPVRTRVVDIVELGAGEARLPNGPYELRELWPDAPKRVARLNRYVRVGLVAVARALEQCGPMPEDTGVILDSEWGCRLTDLVYHERVVVEGADRASRLQFTYTVPSAPAGEAGIVFGLQGPCLTFIGKSGVARAEAERMLRSGRATTLVVLSCDAPEPDGAAAATAVVLQAQ